MATQTYSGINEEKFFVNGKEVAIYYRKNKLTLFREATFTLNKNEVNELINWLIKIQDEV